MGRLNETRFVIPMNVILVPEEMDEDKSAAYDCNSRQIEAYDLVEGYTLQDIDR